MIKSDQIKHKKLLSEKNELEYSAWKYESVSYERQLYDFLYKHYSKENLQSNPCRDFKLK